ncbi:hypothetical protein BC834DRAFT_503102 [Gloeopeniophorella convolvens]|nr:hypothetical protein BC834DRAFT_503102 [Gloeopeniophorella convolvens]
MDRRTQIDIRPHRVLYPKVHVENGFQNEQHDLVILFGHVPLHRAKSKVDPPGRRARVAEDAWEAEIAVPARGLAPRGDPQRGRQGLLRHHARAARRRGAHNRHPRGHGQVVIARAARCAPHFVRRTALVVGSGRVTAIAPILPANDNGHLIAGRTHLAMGYMRRIWYARRNSRQ